MCSRTASGFCPVTVSIYRRAGMRQIYPSPTNVAYMAGFFDGEGYIGITRSTRHTHQMTLHISQKDRSILDEIQSSLGETGYFVRQTNCWALRYSSRKAVRVLQTLLPYLRGKKHQAVLALNFQRYVSKSPRTRPRTRGPWHDAIKEWYRIALQRAKR